MILYLSIVNYKEFNFICNLYYNNLPGIGFLIEVSDISPVDKRFDGGCSWEHLKEFREHFQIPSDGLLYDV